MMRKDFYRNQQDIFPGPKGVRRIEFPLEEFEGFAQAVHPPLAERLGAFNPKNLIHQPGVFQGAFLEQKVAACPRHGKNEQAAKEITADSAVNIRAENQVAKVTEGVLPRFALSIICHFQTNPPSLTGIHPGFFVTLINEEAGL